MLLAKKSEMANTAFANNFEMKTKVNGGMKGDGSDSDESLDLEDSASDGDSDSGGGSIDSEPPPPKKSRVEATKSSKATSAKKLTSPSKSVSKSAPSLPSSKTTSSMGPPASSAPAPSAAPSSSGDITRGPPVTTDAAAKKLIGLYLTQQNRPYSAIQVHDNLHKRIPKATVERVLNSMAQPDSGFICKEYGKAKIYFVDQNTLPSDFTPQQLEQLTSANDELKTENESRAGEERRLRGELQQLLNEPQDSELSELIEQARQRVEEKRERAVRLASGNPASSSSSASTSSTNKQSFRTLAEATGAHNQFRRAWHSRKMLCMEAVDMLSEGMGKKTKDVMAEMCLENDQDVGVTLPALLPEIA